jgi:hypothetical protein
MKLKQNIFIAIFLLIVFPAFCQNSNPVISIEFSVGPSLPVGNYTANSNLSEKSCASAVAGENIQIALEHKMTRHLGLTAMLYAQRNPLNTKALSSQFDNEPFYIEPVGLTGGSQPPVLPPPVYFSNWNTLNRSWYLESILFGLTDEFALDKTGKFSLEIKALVGPAHADLPSLIATSSNDTARNYISKKSGSAYGVSFFGSGSVNYQFTRRIGLTLSIEYLQTTTFNFSAVTESDAVIIGVPNSLNGSITFNSKATAPVKQSVNGLNLNAGISLSLFRSGHK